VQPTQKTRVQKTFFSKKQGLYEQMTMQKTKSVFCTAENAAIAERLAFFFWKGFDILTFVFCTQIHGPL
jgi:hypothetical protein